MYIVLFYKILYYLAIIAQVCRRTNIFINLNSSNISQACSFSSFQQFWKYWRYYIRALEFGTLVAPRMIICLKSINNCWFPNKSCLWCGRIFHDKAWNIFSHQYINTTWQKKKEYSMMWHEIFLEIPSCSCSFAHPLIC